MEGGVGVSNVKHLDLKFQAIIYIYIYIPFISISLRCATFHKLQYILRTSNSTVTLKPLKVSDLVIDWQVQLLRVLYIF